MSIAVQGFLLHDLLMLCYRFQREGRHFYEKQARRVFFALKKV